MEETLQTAPEADTPLTQQESAPAEGQTPAAETAAPEPNPDQAASSDLNSAVQVPEADEEELLSSDEAKQIIENLLFITDRPLKPARIAEVVESVNAKRVLEIINELSKEYADTGRAIRILEIGGGYQMCTKPEYGRWVRRLYNEKMTTRLSNAALETLAIIAYKQPVTRAEMEMIRGVDVAAPLERLLERGLVRVLGKRDTIGRPMVYGTTDEFLRLFGLNKISELPDLQVFAAKQLREKQEDLPFDEKLPPLGEPAILALEEETGDAADAFFKRPKNMFDEELSAQETVQTDAAAQTNTAEAAEEKSGPESVPQQPQPDAPAEGAAPAAPEPVTPVQDAPTQPSVEQEDLK